MVLEFDFQEEKNPHQLVPPPPLPLHPQPPSLSASVPSDCAPSPPSPTIERRSIRRRKKIASKDTAPADSSSSNPSNDNDPPTSILLPSHINLPITIQFLFVPSLNNPISDSINSSSSTSNYSHRIQNHHHVAKTTPLFSYFDGETNRLALKGKDFVTTESISLQNELPLNRRSTDTIIDAAESAPDLKTFESPVKGEVIEWCIFEGQVLRDSDVWATRPLVKIREPCTHSVQWHGQCAICGSDLTIGDYTGISETSRASIPMSHGPSTLTVSVSEAQRLESETRSRLLKARRLSLIVDLDQTIVHATVDPTVGEWMSDPNNPNWSALQDVSRFRLADGPNLSYEGCYYYLKQRPGLSEFLHSLANQYEMHVYTMGTRAYADAVCKIIDPTGEIFASRILSRDESGSMTLKSISRLFPVDTSMVVIIDDRGDVWEYSPNLVPVVPYNFFVGIGDINGAFLPPAQPLEISSLEINHSNLFSTDNKIEDSSIPTMTVTDHSNDSPTSQSPNAEPIALRFKESVSGSLNESIARVQGSSKDSMPSSQVTGTSITASSSGEVTQMAVENTARSKLIADQVLTRPLKQKQLELQEAQRAQKIDSRKRNSGSSGALPMNSSTQGSSNSSNSTVNSSRAPTPVTFNPHSLPLSCSSTDDPLHSTTEPFPSRSYVTESTVHSSDTREVAVDSKFTAQLPPTTQINTTATGEDSSDSSDSNTDPSLNDDLNDEVSQRPVLVDQDTELDRLKSILGDIHTGFYSQDSVDQADAGDVISALKQDVLRGFHIAFSSLWPMDANSEQQNLWKLAEQFGACCYVSLSPKVTHLIAAKLGTSKVNMALSRPNVAVVRPKWLLDAVTLWTRPPEEEYSWRSAITVTPNSLNISAQDEGEFEEDSGDWGAGMNLADWKEARAEVMAALDESDDETTNASVAGETGNYSSDEGDEDRGRSRKRGRTSTASSSSSFAPSGGFSHARTVSAETVTLEESDSPLSKRKRMARSRSSKLKLVLAATDLDEERQEGEVENENKKHDSLTDDRKNMDESSTSSYNLNNNPHQSHVDEQNRIPGEEETRYENVFMGSRTSSGGDIFPLPNLSAEEDEFLTALAAEMEYQITNS